MNNKKPARNIPANIKREVRKRCGFGCVMCGAPIYEYEHMKEWAKYKEHRAEDITLLCPNHHAEKTKGLLPIKIVREKNNNPFNLKNKRSKPTGLYFSGNSCSFVIGGNVFKMKSVSEFPTFLLPILIDGHPILCFNLFKGQLSLNANIYDKNNKLVLKISDNELEYSVDVWDITFISNTLTINQAQRDILLRIKFEPTNTVIIEKAKLYYNEVEVIVEKTKIIIGGKYQNEFSNNVSKNVPVGLFIGKDIDLEVAAAIRMS